MIWFALLIPAFVSVALYVYWQHRICWWEFLVPVIVSVVLIFTCKYLGESYAASDTEYWTGAVKTVEYYEAWNESVPCRHPQYDSKGNYTGNAHLFDVDYHAPYWQITDTNNITLYTTSSEFARLCGKFGNKKFVNLHRFYHTINGNKYVGVWDGKDDNLEVCCTHHRYTNKVQTATSVFNLPKPTQDEIKVYGLYNYPKISGWDQPVIIGLSDPPAERKLSLINAKIGKKKQVRVWVLVYTDKDMESAIKQMNHWQNGNKNELCIAIGIDKEYKVAWVYPFAWSNETLKIEIRDFLNEQSKLDLSAFADWLQPKIESLWSRKEFKDFDYLQVEVPLWMVLLTFFLTIAANIGVSYWCINNDHS